MQWGVLRARASRPPQQPPGLAGSRMLRPPRAPLAVPRCPHRPHGGRLSQPEALQQGSTGAEERWRGRVSPPARGKAGGGMQSAVLTAPLCTLGARPERELELGAHNTLGADLQSLWLTTGAPLRDAPESGSPRLATHEKLSGNLHPQPLPPPRRRLLGVVRPGAAERGGWGVGREKEEGRRGRWLSLRRADEPGGEEGEGRTRAPAVPDTRGRCDHSHVATLLCVLPPPPIQTSPHPLLTGPSQAWRPAPALTAASLHIVLSSGRPWSSPGLIAAAASLRAHPAPCSGTAPREPLS